MCNYIQVYSLTDRQPFSFFFFVVLFLVSIVTADVGTVCTCCSIVFRKLYYTKKLLPVTNSRAYSHAINVQTTS